MASYNDTYSRMVAWLKVLLPVTALALLSTMFLISKSIDPTRALSYARVNLEELTGEQKISDPRFSAVTEDGAAISFSAQSATPDPDRSNLFSAEVLAARIETPNGAVIDINAAEAVIDGGSNRVDLRGGVKLVTSTNYQISTDGLTTSMDATHVESTGPVNAEGPMGTLTAGHAEILKRDGKDGAYVLVFKDGVKLVYDPQKERPSE